MKRTSILIVSAVILLSCVAAFAGSTASKSGKSQGSHVVGEVVSVDAASNSFVIKETLKDQSTKEVTITCQADTKITMAGKSATLSELAAGDHVTVAYQMGNDGKNMAKSVSVAKPPKQGQPSKS